MIHKTRTRPTLGAAALVVSSVLMAGNPMGPIKVGFVYVGPVDDAGWTCQHDLARKQVEKRFRGRVTTHFVQNVPEGVEAERVIRRMAQEGCKVVFATSFGYMNAVIDVARTYPDTVFMHATGYKTAPNVGVYNGRFYEGRYLNGVIAGKMTKTNVAGIVASFPIPEVVMGINAFTRGMRSVNPNAKVKVIWTNAWYDPAKEREAAFTLLNQGADMLTHDTDSTAVVKAAEEKGVGVFSYNSNEINYGPQAQLSGTIHLWGNFYIKTIQSVLAGTWKPENVWGGFNQGLIDLAPFGAKVPKDVRSLVLKLKGDISSGKLHPFTGPIVDEDGKERVPAGQVISDEALEKMDYYVPGVDAKMPNP